MKFNKYTVLQLIIIVFVILIITSLIFPNKNYSSGGFKIEHSNKIDQVNKDKILEQEFISDDNYTKFGIMTGDYGKALIKGYIVLQIENNNEIKKTYRVKISSLVNDEYNFFKYKLKKNKKYKLIISLENNDKPIAIYTTKAKIKGASLKINGEEKKYNIALTFLKKSNNYFSIWYYIFGITLVSLLIVIKKKELKHEK